MVSSIYSVAPQRQTLEVSRFFAGGLVFLQRRLDGTKTIPGHHRCDGMPTVWVSGAAHETSRGLRGHLLDLKAVN